MTMLSKTSWKAETIMEIRARNAVWQLPNIERCDRECYEHDSMIGNNWQIPSRRRVTSRLAVLIQSDLPSSPPQLGICQKIMYRPETKCIAAELGSSVSVVPLRTLCEYVALQVLSETNAEYLQKNDVIKCNCWKKDRLKLTWITATIMSTIPTRNTLLFNHNCNFGKQPSV